MLSHYRGTAKYSNYSGFSNFIDATELEGENNENVPYLEGRGGGKAKCLKKKDPVLVQRRDTGQCSHYITIVIIIEIPWSQETVVHVCGAALPIHQ